MLKFNPNERSSTEELLGHKYFDDVRLKFKEHKNNK
jgi:hypothetical protein